MVSSFVGSPQQNYRQDLYERELFGPTALPAQIDIGGLPRRRVAREMSLFATKVARSFAAIHAAAGIDLDCTFAL